VKTRIQSFSFVAILAVAFGMVSWSSTLHAQTTPSTPTDQQPMPQQASPDNTPTGQTQQPPAQAPEAPPATQQPPTAKAPDQAQSSDSDSGSTTPAAAGVQVFTGTVMKSGDKYVLKDDSGQTYNIDHQDEVAKFEGKHIRVHGTLDEKGAIQVK
jgi:Protein of unknown function (DUF5818)